MYCIHCGVKLADTEKKCPLCGVVVYHPELPTPNQEPPYPADALPDAPPRSLFPHIVATAACLLPILLVLLADYHENRAVTWSGYVVGALLVSYVIVVLPVWFRSPNPVIFTPCAFGAILLYLMYIDLVTPGRWFLPFALPVAGSLGLLSTAVVTLMRYLSKGRLYIFGGAIIALGGLCLLTEFLMTATFGPPVYAGWSLYPLITLFLLGSLLLFFAICGSARQVMERKFFI